MSQSSTLLCSRTRKARQLLQENKLAEARALYEQLCRSAQSDAEPRLNLALINRMMGQYREAEENCRQALALAPNNALAHHIHGSVQFCLGDIDSAIDAYQAALALNPTHAETYYFLGNALQVTGQLGNAAENYRRAIELKPDYLEAMGNLGAVLIALHRFGKAQQVLEEANQQHPGHPQILCNLGDLCMLQDRLEPALDYARAALEINPQFFDAHYLLGRIYRHQRKYDLALQNFSKAAEIRPQNENVIGSIAELLEIRGEFNQARELLQPLIQGNTGNPLVLKAYSALARHFGNEQQAALLLENAITAGQLDSSQRIKLHSELGKQYDRLEDYPRAFEHYSKANRLERELNKHMIEKTARQFVGRESINQWFVHHGHNFWQGLPRSGNTSRRPIFIIGMPRSGTTLAEQILCSHPDVYGAGELPDIDDIARTLGSGKAGADPFQYLEHLGHQELESAAETYLGTLDNLATDAPRVVDKMPTNFWHVAIISLMFPNADIIHMQRDPRDICLSMFFQRFGSSMTFTTDLGELAEYYLAYATIMDHWKSALDIHILDIRYEELVDKPEQVIREMIDFCGLDWDDRCLSFYASDRDVHTPSYDQVRQPMYSKSVDRWKNYATQLSPLTGALNLDN